MRFVKYKRREFHNPKPEKREAALCAFVYDIPYLGSCGIFPPLHILNWVLKRGGGSGGMGPGASWEPFAIDQEEYNELWKTLATLDPKSLGETARYTSIKFKIDPAFDHIQDWKEWIQAVAEKHREDFHKEIRRVENERKEKRRSNMDTSALRFDDFWKAIANQHNTVEALQQYLSTGGDVNAKHPETGSPAFHYAIEMEDIPLVGAMIKAGADLQITNTFGHTPLHRAVDIDIDGVMQKTHSQEGITFEMTQLLLAAGAVPDARDSEAKTPRDWAERYNPRLATQFDALVKTQIDTCDKLALKLRDVDPNVGIQAAKDLLSMGTEGARFLAAELTDLPKRTREGISQLIRARFSFDELVARAKNDELEGVVMLGASQYPGGFNLLLEILIEKLQPHEPGLEELRIWYVIDALGLLGNNKALPKLKELEQDGMSKYKDIDIQKSAKTAIKNIEEQI